MVRCGEISALIIIGVVLLQGLADCDAGCKTIRKDYGSSGSSQADCPRYNYYRYSSTYLSYVPAVGSTKRSRRYTMEMLGAVYWSYYRRYHNYSDTATYANRRIQAHETTSSSVCANYVAGDNETYMGLFICPLDFEPATFTACCGDNYNEYCCELPSNNIVYIIMAIGVVVIGIISGSMHYKRHMRRVRSRRGRVIAPAGPNTTQPAPQGVLPSAPAPGQHLPPPNNNYPPQYGQPYPPSGPQQNTLPPGYSETNYTTPSSFQTVYGLPATAPPSYAAAVAPNTGFSNAAYPPTAPTKF